VTYVVLSLVPVGPLLNCGVRHSVSVSRFLFDTLVF
jgi:hypothetical protein